MVKMFTVLDFYKRFPNDEACLDHLMKLRHGNPSDCPKCGRNAKFYKLSKEPAYSCEWQPDAIARRRARHYRVRKTSS